MAKSMPGHGVALSVPKPWFILEISKKIAIFTDLFLQNCLNYSITNVRDVGPPSGLFLLTEYTCNHGIKLSPINYKTVQFDFRIILHISIYFFVFFASGSAWE